MPEINIQLEQKRMETSPSTELRSEERGPPQKKRNGLLNFFKTRYFPPLIYFCLGIFLLISLFNIVNVYIVHLKVETSVVSVPIETMVSPVAGFIREVYITPGTRVKQGALLMKIENIDLERDLQLARLQVEDAKLTVAYYQNLLDNEQQKLIVYKDIGTNRIAVTQADVDKSKQEVRAAKNNLERIYTLYKKHYVTKTHWDEALTKYRTSEENMKRAVAQRNIETNSLSALKNSLYFTGDRLEGMSGNLNVEIDAAQKRLKLNQDKVKIYEGILNKLNLVAPFDAKVILILKTAGNTTDSVKPILFLEPTQSKKTIISYLTQSEITHVKATGKVNIYIPALGKTYLGRIANVDRTAGFVDGMNAQYRWRDLQIDRSATVIIDIEGRDQENFNRQVSAGMPAIVYFTKKYNFL